jgi:hypothetical protein
MSRPTWRPSRAKAPRRTTNSAVRMMIRRIAFALLFIGLLGVSVPLGRANEKRLGYCQLQTVGTRVTNCTVTVYITNTVSLATIYSDNLGTPLANPFTASAVTGLWQFYAANGRYDIQFSGGSPTISPAYTLSDFLFLDLGTAGQSQSIAGDLLPALTNTGNVGNASFTWLNGYFKNLTVVTTATLNGGSLAGTYTGSPTLSGNPVFSGAPIFSNSTTVPKLNNLIYVDGVTYPFTTAGIQAAIAAAIAAGGGIVDARGATSMTITSEIDVGNHAQVPVTLLLPQAATWTVTGITNGTSCAIKQFSQSSVIGPGTGGSSAMIIHGGLASNNLDSIYCTEASPSGNGSYIRAEGFQIFNPNGATMANGAANIQALFDDSDIHDIVVASYGTVGLNVHGLICCGTEFHNLTSNANHTAGSIPVQINLSSGSGAVAFYNLSADHPGTGNNAIKITNVNNQRAVRFYNTYSEGNNADTTTANISAGSTAGPIEFYGVTCNDNPSSTAYCIDIPVSGQVSVRAYGVEQVVGGSSNCINDHYTPRTLACDANGNLTMSVMGTSYMTAISGAIIPVNFTTAGATTSDVITVTGMTANGHCLFSQSNALAATGEAAGTTWLDTPAANAITLHHTNTNGQLFTILCTPN